MNKKWNEVAYIYHFYIYTWACVKFDFWEGEGGVKIYGLRLNLFLTLKLRDILIV